MDKLEEFKEFASKNPHLGMMVHKKEATWQSLFETYDIYGKDHEIFKLPTTTNQAKDTINSGQADQGNATSSASANGDANNKINWSNVINTISAIDLAKVSDGLSGLKKIVDIFGEFSNRSGNGNQSNGNRRPFRRYND